MRLLILGGTGEARALAAALHGRPGFSVTSSLAGRVRNPALPAGSVHIGGFGGPSGLAAYLIEQAVEVVVDATHPFAPTITANAVAAAAETGVPLLTLRRPGWTERDGDRWHRVPSVDAAAAMVLELTDPGAAVLVTTGRRQLAPFVPDGERHYVIRAVDEPRTGLPPRHTLVLDRGPYTVDGERELMRRHGVRVLVTKDSGGELTAAKLTAARLLGIPVVMVDRPPLPPGADPVVTTVDAAADWCDVRAG
ncbi:MAG TPA: cobalt-precorrin-6A reductase [Mycobacteriales bacterium]|jgi:precorrin-6A/cobalt-precorrin-6A reductase|nr:cobalt-precorrin-6A reductase [Mycobacteriales bacterium]